MEEDIELLRSMYIEGKELTINHQSHITRITFCLSNLISIQQEEELYLIIDILSDHEVVSDVKLKSGDKSASLLNSDLPDINLSDTVPSDILTQVSENIETMKEIMFKNYPEQTSNVDSDLNLRRIIYKLDHMRNENKYKKCLAKFAKQTGCNCLLYSGKHGIRIVVEGEHSSAKEFVKLNKTTSVDVDSTGRPCKERLIEIISETPIKEMCLEDQFTSITDPNEIHSIFLRQQLSL
ncbi:RWD domain-containing protein 3-like [Bolinopsis microptera]|uniref:RWD domain-containing protein 3-like n=1 Tax=Bolinopsis microptera TaxID=2820187 RepID=UPI003079DE0C